LITGNTHTMAGSVGLCFRRLAEAWRLLIDPPLLRQNNAMRQQFTANALEKRMKPMFTIALHYR
jgi:hypothetical protein